MINKIGIIWIVIATLYFIYSAMLAKHGLMFINTTATVVMIVIGGYYLIKK